MSIVAMVYPLLHLFDIFIAPCKSSEACLLLILLAQTAAITIPSVKKRIRGAQPTGDLKGSSTNRLVIRREDAHTGGRQTNVRIIFLVM